MTVQKMRINRSNPARAVLNSLLFLSATAAFAQTRVTEETPAAGVSIHLTDVVQSALHDYPQIHVTQEEFNAAVANIQLARTAYLPRADGLIQANRATRNNVYGLLLPQTVLPSMSGPVIGSNNGGSVWGSAAGLLVAWQPFDFGLRHADVEAARAGRDKAGATVERNQLEVAAAAADAYLTLIAAGQTEKSAAAAVQNWDVLLRSIHALASAQLRPGADESRIEAELAIARTQLVYARQASDTSKATLAKFLSRAEDANATLDSAHLLAELPPPEEDERPFQTATHPVMAEQKASVAQSEAQLHATERSWVPQFTLEGAAYARGTGAEVDGQRLPGANGLAPSVQNYAVGVTITFPFMDFVSVHAREAAQAATLRANKANEQLADKTLQEQYAKAKATLRAAREVAANTPIEVRSAHMAFGQAKARYQAGLVPIDDLAQAQRLVVQAEIDDSIARLNVWRALLQLDAARGDIQPFLQAASK
jgi:outer membrane protein